jgi:SAM-dependent methyltransferase
MESTDPEELRAELRECWESAAEGWGDPAEPFYAAALPISHWMVEHLAPQPGQTVLELAAGRGDTGFLAAELLHPGGKLICTDGAEAMVEIARQRGEQLGIRGVEYRTMELEWLDVPTATLDGILCRFGYMLIVDPEAALREARRALRPGGRLVIAVWSTADVNPWVATAGEELRRLGLAPPSEPGAPGPFSLGEPGAVEALIEDAGFDAPTVEPIDITLRAPDPDAAWEIVRAMSPSVRTLLPTLAPADVYRLRDALDARWAPYVADDGTLAVPGRALGVATEA